MPLLKVVPVPKPLSPSALQGDEPNDAIARSFVLLRDASQADEVFDAISREFMLSKDTGQANSVNDAIAREFMLTKDSGQANTINDAISREFMLNRGSDASGIPTDAIAREFILSIQDVIAPQVKITAGPREGGQIAPGPVTIQWMGQDNLTPQNALQYQFRLNKGVWSGWALTTQTTTSSLTTAIRHAQTFTAGWNGMKRHAARTASTKSNPPIEAQSSRSITISIIGFAPPISRPKHAAL